MTGCDKHDRAKTKVQQQSSGSYMTLQKCKGIFLPNAGLKHACHDLVHNCLTNVEATDLCTPVLEVSKCRLKLFPAQIGDCDVHSSHRTGYDMLTKVNLIQEQSIMLTRTWMTLADTSLMNRVLRCKGLR